MRRAHSLALRPAQVRSKHARCRTRVVSSIRNHTRLPWLGAALVGSLAHAQGPTSEPAPPPTVAQELARLRARIDAPFAPYAPYVTGPLFLGDDELDAIPEANSNHVLSRPWFDNVDLHGFAAVTYLDSGRAGSAPGGEFSLKEATLFLEAEAWENVAVVVELWAARYYYGNRFKANELYVDVGGLGTEDAQLGLRAGGFEVPFGEEYLRWDAHETPLIVFSAADPYGVDDGLELYGALGPVGWIAALSNGGDEGGYGKLFTGKVYGDVFRELYLSESVLASGTTNGSSLFLSGNRIGPVGANGSSTLGASPSDEVEATCWELDARVGGARRGSLLLQLGGGRIASYAARAPSRRPGARDRTRGARRTR